MPEFSYEVICRYSGLALQLRADVPVAVSGGSFFDTDYTSITPATGWHGYSTNCTGSHDFEPAKNDPGPFVLSFFASHRLLHDALHDEQ
jgi:hypothetical protein